MNTKLDGRVRILFFPGEVFTGAAREMLYFLRRSRHPAVGLDQLAAANFSLLRGRNFALLVNNTSRLANKDHIVSVLMKHKLPPKIIMEPEHGLYGALEQEGPDRIRKEPRFGLRVLNLHGKNTVRPRKQHLKGVDLIVVDLENLPVRCYTYVSTLTYVLEAAAEQNLEVLILDRANPYGAWRAQGDFPKEGYRSFVAEANVPFLYSMSLGEYAIFLARTRLTTLRLSIVRVRDYSRDDLSSALARVWINPSPNIPSPEVALVYPGMVFFEGANVSLGRGTTRPFVFSGAPWMRAHAVVRELRRLDLEGVRFAAVTFQPTGSLYAGVFCEGVQIAPLSHRFDPLRTGYEYMRIVRRLHPNQFQITKVENVVVVDRLWGGPGYRNAIESDMSWGEFQRTWRAAADGFEKDTRGDRLY